MKASSVALFGGAVALLYLSASGLKAQGLGDGGVDSGSVYLSGQPPQPGSLQKMQTLELWVSPQAQAFFADAGVALTMVGSGNYATVQARTWWFPDGGYDTGPNWPSGVVVVAALGPTLCASAQICRAYDGGVDNALNTSSGCVCAVDATCVGTAPDGGTSKPVPHGITLPGAGWTGPFSGNCVAKACGDLWTTLPDGGPDTSWPPACPTQ